MGRPDHYTLDWSWWVRSGERIALGLDLRRLFSGRDTTLGSGMRRGLERCTGFLEEGDGLVRAMRRSGLALADEAWCLLQAGERTGRLGEAMCEVGEHIKQAQNRRKEVVGQLWYPGFVSLTGIVVMAIILFWVVPQLRDISNSMGADGEFPWLTENIGRLYGGMMVLFVGVLSVSLTGWHVIKRLARRSLKWARVLELLAGWIPVAGQLRGLAREARILRQIGTLLRGGITFPSALEMAASNSPDQFETYQLTEFRKRQLMGISFEEGLAACSLFNQENHPLLVTGQETGRFDTFALRIADDADRELSWRLKQLVRAIEPATVISLAALVAGLVMAYMLPTIHMLEQLA